MRWVAAREQQKEAMPTVHVDVPFVRDILVVHDLSRHASVAVAAARARRTGRASE